MTDANHEFNQVSEMTSRQRVLAALKREPVDRTPVCNPTSVATVELMDLVDAHFPDANQGNWLVSNCIGFRGVLQYEFSDDDGEPFGVGGAHRPGEPPRAAARRVSILQNL